MADISQVFNLTQYADRVSDTIFDIDTTWFAVVLAICGMVLGLLMAVLGTRVLKFSTFCLGFALLGMLVATITAKITEGKDQNACLIAGGIGGLVGGVLAVCIVRVGKAVVGGGLAVLVVLLFVQSGLANKIGKNYVVWIALGVLLLLGVFLAFKYQDHLFVVVTAFGGAFTFTLGLAQFIPDTEMGLIRFFSDPSSVMCGFTAGGVGGSSTGGLVSAPRTAVAGNMTSGTIAGGGNAATGGNAAANSNSIDNGDRPAAASPSPDTDDRCLALILTWLGLGFICMIVQWQMNEKTKGCRCLGESGGDDDDDDDGDEYGERRPMFRARLVGQRAQQQSDGSPRRSRSRSRSQSHSRSRSGSKGGKKRKSGGADDHVAIEMA